MQTELYDSYEAFRIADHFRKLVADASTLELWEHVNNLHDQMKEEAIQSDSFKLLEVVGMGVLYDAFIWQMQDKSWLVVGFNSPDNVTDLIVGVLPPDTKFSPIPLPGGRSHLH